MTKPENTALKIGDKEFSLNLVTNKTIEFEELTGDSVLDFEGSITHARALLFVMIKGQNGVNTIEEAGNLMDEDPAVVNEAVNKATIAYLNRFA